MEGKKGGLDKNIKIFLNRFLGPALFCWLAWATYEQVVRQPDIDLHLRAMLDALGGPAAWRLALVFLLMAVNWGLEALKWRLLLRRLHPVGMAAAFRGILAGVAFSLNTPNRIGEYGGRILHLPEGRRLQAVSLAFAGGAAQVLVTFMAGGVGIALLSGILGSRLPGDRQQAWLLLMASGVVAASLVAIVFYFRVGRLGGLLSRIPWLRKAAVHLSALQDTGRPLLARVLLLSVLRFTVFALQYCLMLQAMQVHIGLWEGFWTVAVFFLAMSLMPTIALLELGFRWQYSLLLFGLYSTNTIGIYAAATGIWLVNLVVPAAAGTLLLLGMRRPSAP